MVQLGLEGLEDLNFPHFSLSWGWWPAKWALRKKYAKTNYFYSIVTPIYVECNKIYQSKVCCQEFWCVLSDQPGVWALEKSLTRPLFFLYFQEIRKKWSHWPGSQSAPRLYNHYNLWPGKKSWEFEGKILCYHELLLQCLCIPLCMKVMSELGLRLVWLHCCKSQRKIIWIFDSTSNMNQ